MSVRLGVAGRGEYGTKLGVTTNREYLFEVMQMFKNDSSDDCTSL